jgi:hypothetical protein
VTEAPERYIGSGVPRKEDPALVTGRANWTDNIKLPGMLHVTLLRSPYAHAKITRIDTSEAKMFRQPKNNPVSLPSSPATTSRKIGTRTPRPTRLQSLGTG